MLVYVTFLPFPNLEKLNRYSATTRSKGFTVFINTPMYLKEIAHSPMVFERSYPYSNDI